MAKQRRTQAPSVRELARTTGVSELAIRAAIERGELRAFRFGAQKITVDPGDFETWRASRVVRPDPEPA
jgi:excisionase family DNA binding protein